MADILIVDDDQSIAMAFEHFLTYEGHTFRLASSAAEGMALIEERSPDVVMMDVRMPGVDGLTALQQMKRRPPWPHQRQYSPSIFTSEAMMWPTIRPKLATAT